MIEKTTTRKRGQNLRRDATIKKGVRMLTLKILKERNIIWRRRTFEGKMDRKRKEELNPNERIIEWYEKMRVRGAKKIRT